MKSTEKTVTLHDVARHSGVSYQTVSRVINQHPSVSEETRRRVLKSIQELKYRPNRAARSLVTNRSDTIAIISFGTTFYGPGQMLSNITQQAKNRGYLVSPSAVELLGPVEVTEALDKIYEHRFDGLIIIAPILSDFMEGIRDRIGSIPFILIDTKPQPGMATVGIEQDFGTRLAVEHLISLGHRKIAEISGPMNWYDAIMRHQSWKDTMERHGLSADMTVEGHWSAQSGYEGIQTLLRAGAEFTGLVVSNDQMALGAIAALNEWGFHIPRDVSIVGFDDIPESAYFLPALTTVHQDFKSLGEQAVDYLVSLIQNPATPVHQRVLYPELIVRQSTAPVTPA